MSKNTKILILCIAYAALSIAGLLNSFRVSNLEKQVDKLQSTQTKLEKRVDNLTQAMQTKDKELEA
jgi:outer membrane murein-binding lipoprotein Lpp